MESLSGNWEAFFWFFLEKQAYLFDQGIFI